MPEKEIKFSESEIDEKHKEALAMDKKAKEMVEKGEAKTPQEAVEKIEEAELKKSPEEMLKEALPLVLEEALKFTQEKGFASAQEIKKQIDLAKKYNLELEHFFYDPAKLEREVPTQEQIKKTAKELRYVNELAEELSRQSKKPVYCIFNARNGTIYAYGMDTLNSQLNFQFEELARRKGAVVQELRDKFAKEIRKNRFWRQNKKAAFIEVAGAWLSQKQLDFFNIIDHSKIPSTHIEFMHQRYYETSMEFLDQYLDKSQIIEKIKFTPLKLFIDASGALLPRSLSFFDEIPDLLSKLEARLRPFSLNRQSFPWTNRSTASNGRWFLADKTEEALDTLIRSNRKQIFINPLFKDSRVWFDNFPQTLGKLGKKFSHPCADRKKKKKLYIPLNESCKALSA